MTSTTTKETEIMLIEDKEDDILLAKLALNTLSIKTTLSSQKTGLEALKEIKSRLDKKAKLPNLIILDINLPILNGLDVLKEMNSLDIVNSIPVVIFTSTDSKEDIKECYKLGARKFIKKPNNINDLKNIMGLIMEEFMPPHKL